MTPEEINATRLFVLQRAIFALIVTHSDPAAFARVFALATAGQQLDQIAFAKAIPGALSESKEFAKEFLDLANDEVVRREEGKPLSS